MAKDLLLRISFMLVSSLHLKVFLLAPRFNHFKQFSFAVPFLTSSSPRGFFSAASFLLAFVFMIILDYSSRKNSSLLFKLKQLLTTFHPPCRTLTACV
jgi:hypothetical protein